MVPCCCLRYESLAAPVPNTTDGSIVFTTSWNTWSKTGILFPSPKYTQVYNRRSLCGHGSNPPVIASRALSWLVCSIFNSEIAMLLRIAWALN